jgi:hypothetical protein
MPLGWEKPKLWDAKRRTWTSPIPNPGLVPTDAATIDNEAEIPDEAHDMKQLVGEYAETVPFRAEL